MRGGGKGLVLRLHVTFTSWQSHAVSLAGTLVALQQQEENTQI